MKIEGPIKPVDKPHTGDQPARPRPGNEQAPGTEASQVELSSMGKAQAAMEDTPLVNQGKVDEIRQAMSDGRFQVNAERIADGLLDSVREMLGSSEDKSS